MVVARDHRLSAPGPLVLLRTSMSKTNQTSLLWTIALGQPGVQVKPAEGEVLVVEVLSIIEEVLEEGEVDSILVGAVWVVSEAAAEDGEIGKR